MNCYCVQRHMHVYIHTCVSALMGLHMVSLATSMKPIATSCKVIALKDEPLWSLRKEFTCIRKQKHKYVTMNAYINQFYTTLVITAFCLAQSMLNMALDTSLQLLLHMQFTSSIMYKLHQTFLHQPNLFTYSKQA